MYQSGPQFPVDIGAVAIDLDGTLLDTLPDIAEAADRMLAELGRPPVAPEIVRGYVGDGIPRLTKRLLTGLPRRRARSRARSRSRWRHSSATTATPSHAARGPSPASSPAWNACARRGFGSLA